MTAADTVIHPQFIVPVVPRGEVMTGHSVVLRNGRVDAILPTPEALVLPATEHVALDGQALLPGLVNCHGHAAMSLLRGYADDYPLQTWLTEHIWPAETTHVSESFVADGTDLALADLLLGGTTTFSDMYFFPDITAERAERAGVRAQIMFPIIDVPTAWASQAEEYLSKGLTVRDRFHNSALIEIGFGPHSNYTVSEATLKRSAMLADQVDAPLQIHLHETADEVAQSITRIGERPIAQLARIGFLGPRTQCVHMTELSSEDIDTVARYGAHVIHCPRSNMKLASGICPAQGLLDRGINVALGTDGAASNNRLNMFNEMQTGALLAKVGTGESTALSAINSLEMATINGARALGMADNIGSIEVGKRADLIGIDLMRPATQPIHNVISQLVYATSGNELLNSWIDGRRVVSEGVLTSLDETVILERAQEWQRKLAEHPAHH
ncbi:amidohydrolase [Luminiphilus syltensis NOR5-1B]|uniref:Amidohydrolase n=1 Tax=Luminiphilus syltensis NOR5-1B TaxID=565045 RepID=B8KQJ3_9GAMM|nr:TRZ/ATZ family hydrolase [Luminiphilus syltensis]EED34173.1 amidohydrolase [Luminiphilus syltensis NOR5-1B]